jgi:DNA-binding response OmpR family regulator
VILVSPGTSNRTTVLIAEDEQHLADLYTDYLADEYDVLSAYGGEKAMDYIRDPDVDIDIALLDRRMPDLSGDKVLANLNEDGRDCQVAMVTAVNPGFDIIDMGCDEYLVKPVSQDELVEVVGRLEKLSTYGEKHQDLTAKKLKRNVLTVEKSAPELANSERYKELEAEIETLEAELDDITDELEPEFEDLQRHI